jgi:hypothetical protein
MEQFFATLTEENTKVKKTKLNYALNKQNWNASVFLFLYRDSEDAAISYIEGLIENKNIKNSDWWDISGGSKYTDNYTLNNLLTGKFINKFAKYLDWRTITRYQKLSEKVIRKNISCINKNKHHWNNISQYQVLSKEFIIEFQDSINWEYISKNYNVIEDWNFVEKYKYRINWQYVTAYYKLSEYFIEKFIEVLDNYWWELCHYQELSEGFMEKYKDRLLWSLVGSYQKMSFDFLIKYQKSLNVNHIKANNKINKSDKKKFLDFLKLIK